MAKAELKDTLAPAAIDRRAWPEGGQPAGREVRPAA